MDGAVVPERDVFKPDGFGSLQDIYVLNTDARDWQRVIDHVRGGGLPHSFHVDGQPRPLPTAVGDVFRLREDAVTGLAVDLDGVLVRCHFFDESEIEFDLDPRDVVRSEQADRVLGFVQELADLLCKPVLLTPENDPDHPLVRREPLAQTER